jgi:hypothetical protein
VQRRQIVGGASQGQGIVAGPQTDAGPVAAGLGQFFNTLMEPYVQRKQQEKLFEGYTAAQSGIALEELDKSNSGINQIFGPNSFEEGAQFYAAQTAINTWQTSAMEDMDALKRLPPAEVAKVIAEKSRSMMTGHGAADQLIQNGILQASAPLLSTIAKARFEWQQTEAVRATGDAWASGATALQRVMSAQAGLSAPTDQDNTATAASIAGFRESMAKPAGMTDASYKGMLYDFMRNQQQAGNFYAVEVMKRAGVYGVLDDDQQGKLEDSYVKYGNRLLGEAAIGQATDLIKLDALVKQAKISATDAGLALGTINQRLKAQTGVDMDLFDYEDIRTMGGNVVDALIATNRRRQDRAWQVEDRDRAIAARREDDAAEDATVASQVSTMAAMGQAATGIAAGAGTKNDYDLVLSNAYRTGNLGMIVKNFENGYTSDFVANAMQSPIANAIGGDAYTKEVGAAYSRWSALNKIRPAAAAAYYGSYHTAMQRFDSLKRGGMSDQLAYVRSFADPSIHGDADIPQERRKEVKEAVEDHLAGTGSRWYNPLSWGNYNLNASSQAAVAGAVNRQVAIASKNTDQPTAQLVQSAIEQAQANGSLEQAGQFAWTNRPGTRPLHTLLGVQKPEADKAFMEVLDTQLRARGFSDGAYGDSYNVVRIKGPDGQAAIHVSAMGADPSEHREVLITLADLKAQVTGGIATQVRGNQPAPDEPHRHKPHVNAHRRVPGETGLQRTLRINREVAAGADPVNHQGN